MVAGVSQHKDDPDWQGIEDDVAVVAVQSNIDRNTMQLDSRCVATLSLHAFARRLQRHQDGTIEALLHETPWSRKPPLSRSHRARDTGSEPTRTAVDGAAA